MTITATPADKTKSSDATTRQDSGSLIDKYLDDQQQLTAVERFSAFHESLRSPTQAKYYRDLIPLEKPTAGEQYAFDVNLDLCSGCKACVSACHHMNGLETNETWRFVGQLTGVDTQSLPVVQHVTTACHHCLDPGCLTGCPTNAYEKDPVTGVVRHLDDQCFGCQYCTMACPYEVPQYSASKGIVRKCDMCHDRLSVGEAPACVQACPNQAIRITKVRLDDVKSRAASDTFLAERLPASVPSPAITSPTTVYRTERALADAIAPADAEFIQRQHAHGPLVAMLVLTQFGVGLLTLAILMSWSDALDDSYIFTVSSIATAVITHLGLLAALLHLGRPHLAFRSVLGWRHSWLSREAIVFGLFAPTTIVIAIYSIWPTLPVREQLQILLQIVAIVTGLAGIFCSAKIYQFTQRAFWSGIRTGLKFGLTPIVLGLAALLSISLFDASLVHVSRTVAISLIVTSLGKIGYEIWQLRLNQPIDSLRQSAQLMRGDLLLATATRFACGVTGGIFIPLAVLTIAGPATLVLSMVALLCCIVGEFLERYLYFSAVVPLKMPGGIPS